MDGRIALLGKHRIAWAMGLSTMLHFFLLLLLSRQGEMLFFQLPDRSDNRPEKRIAFEIVETPEENRSQVPPDEAQLLSDKNSIARDGQQKNLADEGLPYSQGDTDVKQFPVVAGNETAGNRSQPEKQASGEPLTVKDEISYYGRSSDDTPKFNRDMLLGRRERIQSSYPQPAYDQRDMSTEELGGFSFNTYAWDFAPYLIDLKRRIQRNIYPPPAFTQLGFGGNNILRFRIYPDGRLEGPGVLGYHGEKALIETSRKAVEFSAPFKPLPDDFPEEYLQVTARFEYYVMGRH